MGPGEGSADGFVVLPSGRRIRGGAMTGDRPRGWHPRLALHLSWRRPRAPEWEREWIRWPDFRGPSDPAAALAVLREAHRRSLEEDVEILCRGGVARTGTALAALVVLEGRKPESAAAWVRANYAPRAVQTMWQWTFLFRVSSGALDG